MIKANELRIGNILHHEDNENIGIVECIYQMDDVWFLEWEQLSDRSKGGSWHLTEFCPIPLTPEWLERCGFTKGDAYDITHNLERGEEYYWYNDRLIWYHRLKNKRVDECYDHIKHLHQLQNLYFALTGGRVKN